MPRSSSVVVALAMVSLVASAAAAACSSFEDEPPADDAGGGDAAGGSDAPAESATGADAGPEGAIGLEGGPRCGTFTPFTKVGPLPGTVNTAGDENGPRLLNNGLTLVFHRPVAGIDRMYVATRGDAKAPFGSVAQMPIELPLLDTAHATFSADELTMYFETKQAGPAGDIYRQSRQARTDPFSNRTAVGVSGGGVELEPWISGDELFFTTQEPTAYSIYVATANGVGGFTPRKRVAGVNDEMEAGVSNTHAVLTADGLVMYFAREIAGDYDMWVARRSAVGMGFTNATKLAGADINSLETDVPGWISPDECTLYFATRRGDAGDYQIYVAERLPLPL